VKVIDSRVIGVRSARLCLTLDDGTSHVVDIEGPVTGTVHTVEDEVDVSTFSDPAAAVAGRTRVLVDLSGFLTSRRVLFGVAP
jgi:hypothetical protein